MRQIVAEARQLVEQRFSRVWIAGEVSDFRPVASGHWYFNLKDEDARIRCAMFASRNRFARFQMRDGHSVVVVARLSVYESRGDFQAVVDRIELAGEGALRAALERLKAKLAGEGLFAVERKRALPRQPRHIAVVTSRAGAALRDVLAVLGRRYPCARVTCFDVAVQGVQAPGQIVVALERAERMRRPPDVVIITRGGGSLEDLAAFNTELVARRVAACGIPVVSAVGHETDVTLVDFAADQRAPTPSAAAELVTPEAAELLAQVRRLAASLAAGMASRLRADRQLLEAQRRRLAHPGRVIEQRMLRADEMLERLTAAIKARIRQSATAFAHQRALLARSSPGAEIAAAKERLRTTSGRMAAAARTCRERSDARLAAASRALAAVSPLATLDRGFAIVSKPGASRWGQPLASVADAAPGDVVVAHLSDGSLRARVEHSAAEPRVAETRANATGEERA